MVWMHRDTKPEGKMQRQRLDELFNAVGDARHMLIIPHNDPDPDAIGAALALRHLLAERLGLQGRIAYRGIIGRAENKALVRYLGQPLHRLAPADLEKGIPLALIDTQPGAGNNPVPAEQEVALVFDHHPRRQASEAARFAEVRSDVGAISTVLTEVLQAAALEPPQSLATALFYGIKTDTQGLIRGAGPSDVAAYMYLQARIDVPALSKIENAQLPVEYFRGLSTTLHAARMYGSVITSYVGEMGRPDLAAEMADLLLRLRGVRWVICLGVHKGVLVLAVRTRNRRGGAEQLVIHVAGHEGTAGGHGTMAGGQVPLRGQDPVQLAHQLVQRALNYLDVAPEQEGQPLI
jgi:nanoRNase/pAp phosphatase (c-di-AMP/oligoRNAs hydrolase)